MNSAPKADVVTTVYRMLLEQYLQSPEGQGTRPIIVERMRASEAWLSSWARMELATLHQLRCMLDEVDEKRLEKGMKRKLLLTLGSMGMRCRASGAM